MSLAGKRERRLVAGPVVAATHNSGKLRELADLLRPCGIEAVGAAALGLLEPEETGATFRDNAILKAEAAARASGRAALADDSGLGVAALGGRPGIHSARWAEGAAGEPRDFAAAMARIEGELRAAGAPRPWRAQFVCALALAWPDGGTEVFEGRVDGDLVFPPRGSRGFGYDPIFRPDGHDRTFGEMSAEEKHGLPPDGSPGLSHRTRAFHEFARALLTP
jgi:XTP/dITP diphosphohydrolase